MKPEYFEIDNQTYIVMTDTEQHGEIQAQEQLPVVRLKTNVVENWRKTPLIKYLKSGGIPAAWLDFFKFMKNDLETISRDIHRVAQDVVVYPRMFKVFEAFYITAPENIKVVILGQDPYFNGAACGLSFSVPPHIRNINPSLLNIYRKLKMEGFRANNETGNLTKWAQQGVFLLNCSLTVTKGIAGSHQEIWANFARNIVTYISTHCENVVFILWGRPAQIMGSKIDVQRHCIIAGAHPSPMSAEKYGFFNKQYFTPCNTYLMSHDKEPIDWNLC